MLVQGVAFEQVQIEVEDSFKEVYDEVSTTAHAALLSRYQRLGSPCNHNSAFSRRQCKLNA